jgi:Tol biopolymer transport system component
MHFQLYTVNPDGSALERLTHYDGAAAGPIWPSWSPDSTRIAYAQANEPPQRQLYTMNADGSDQSLVFDDQPGYIDDAPDWTSDGQHLVFDRCRPDPPGGCAIYSVALDGSDLTAITRYRTGIRAGGDLVPRVSPDGDWVAFTRVGWNGTRFQLWLVRLDGSDAHPITKPRLTLGYAQWAAGGTDLYAMTNTPTGFNQHIYRVPADGGAATQLTFGQWPNSDLIPSPSPSGRWITFMSDRRKLHNKLFVMRSHGTHQHYVGFGGLLVDFPDWGTAPLKTGPSVRIATVPDRQPRAAESQRSLLGGLPAGRAVVLDGAPSYVRSIAP